MDVDVRQAIRLDNVDVVRAAAASLFRARFAAMPEAQTLATSADYSPQDVTGGELDIAPIATGQISLRASIFLDFPSSHQADPLGQ